MNTIFENATHADKKMYINSYKQYYANSLEAYLIFGIIFLTMTIFMLLRLDWISALPSVLVSYLSFASFYKLRNSFKKNYIWDQKRNTPEGIYYKFFEDRIEFSSANAWMKYEYSDIKKVSETSAAIIIGFINVFIIIDKQGFKKGNPVEFKSFIENKRKENFTQKI